MKALFTFKLPFRIYIAADSSYSPIVVQGTTKATPCTVKILQPVCDEPGDGDLWIDDVRRITSTDKLKIEVEAQPAEGAAPLRPRDLDEAALDAIHRLVAAVRSSSQQEHLLLREGTFSFDIDLVDQDGAVQTSASTTWVLNFADDEIRYLDAHSWEMAAAMLRDNLEIPLWQDVLLDARLYRDRHDHRVALILSAVVIEIAMTSFLRKRLTVDLTQKGITPNEIGKYIEQISNRLLVRVALSWHTDIPHHEELLNCRKVLIDRNALLHGQKRAVTAREASDAILAAEWLVTLPEVRATLPQPRAKKKETKRQ